MKGNTDVRAAPPPPAPPHHHVICTRALRWLGSAARSRPAGCIEENTTAHLVEDLELLRSHLGIDKWMVFGGSWGSCLALAYVDKYPDAVSALIVRGILTMTKAETDFYYEPGGCARRIGGPREPRWRTAHGTLGLILF